MYPQKNVLITGGTGLVGKALSGLLVEKGYQVSILSRSALVLPGIRCYQWIPEKEYIEEGALENMDYLVHLAGANVGEALWTPARKRAIMNSRTATLELLFKKMTDTGRWPEAIVSASGISCYNGLDFEKKYDEYAAPSGNSFLARVVLEWEMKADEFAKRNIRTVKLRTGIVLHPKGGALRKLAIPAKLGLAAAFGTGKQWISWIHLTDLCRLYLRALESPSFHGVYNAVAPDCVTNRSFTAMLCKSLKKPFWLPDIPSWLLKGLLGEMSSVLLEGPYCENYRIAHETDFKYTYPSLQDAFTAMFPQTAHARNV